jgi:ribonuclease P protein component
MVLRTKTDFENLFRKGHRLYPSSWMILNFNSNNLSCLRYGLTVSRAVGNAVMRNKLKRWSREYLRGTSRELDFSKDKGLDINVVFKKVNDEFYKKLTYDEFESVLDRAWPKLRKKIGDNS